MLHDARPAAAVPVGATSTSTAPSASRATARRCWSRTIAPTSTRSRSACCWPRRPARAVPRQEGGLRRPDRRRHRRLRSAGSGSTGAAVRRTAPSGQDALAAGRAGGGHAPGDHPSWPGVLRPRAEGPLGCGQARRGRRRFPSSRSASGAPRQVWPRSSKLPERDQPAGILRPCRIRVGEPVRMKHRSVEGGHQADDGGRSRPCCRRRPGDAANPPRRSWRATYPGGVVPDDVDEQPSTRPTAVPVPTDGIGRPIRPSAGSGRDGVGLDPQSSVEGRGSGGAGPDDVERRARTEPLDVLRAHRVVALERQRRAVGLGRARTRPACRVPGPPARGC